MMQSRETSTVEDPVFLMKKQLFWSRLTGILFLVITALLIASLVTMGVYMHRFDNLAKQADRTAMQLEAATAEMEKVDWEAVANSLTILSRDLAVVDWLTLTDQIGDLAVEAESSLQVAQKAIEDLDIATLNEAIAELRDVIRPLAMMINRFSN